MRQIRIFALVALLAIGLGALGLAFAPPPPVATLSSVTSTGKVNVRQFGAKGDGTTNDTAAFTAAVTRLGSRGGTVYIPSGTYLVNNWLIAIGNITVEGDGVASILTSNTTTGDTIRIQSATAPTGMLHNVNLRNFCIKSSVVKTAGAAIYCQSVDRMDLYNLRVGLIEDGPNYNHFNGIMLLSSCHCHVHNVHAFASGTCLALSGGNNGAANDLKNQGWDIFVNDGNCFCSGNASNSIGILFGGGQGGCIVDDTEIQQCSTGIKVDTSLGGGINRELFFKKVFCDSSGGHGIDIGQNSLQILNLDNTWMAGSGRTNSAGAGLNIQVSNNALIVKATGLHCYANANTGIVMASGRLNLSGSVIYQNGTSFGGHGVDLSGTGVSSVTMTGNDIFGNGTASRGYGVNIVTGINNYLITTNTIRANVQGQINDAAAGANKIVTGNLN